MVSDAIKELRSIKRLANPGLSPTHGLAMVNLRYIEKHVAAIEAALSSAQAPEYVIWSNEHRAWWRSNSAGYTIHLSAAGRYSQADALAIAKDAHDGWRDGTPPPEIVVRLADAEFCVPAAPHPPAGKQ